MMGYMFWMPRSAFHYPSPNALLCRGLKSSLPSDKPKQRCHYCTNMSRRSDPATARSPLSSR